MDGLIRDLQQELPSVWGRPIRSIFIGGGTPSLFPAEQIERLLSAVRALIPLGPDPEITLEANPGAAEQERFTGYREAGVNRLSIGVQSFNSSQLQRIGRIHDGEEALHAVTMARQAGFERINLDLMFALPGQTEAEAMADLQQAIDLEVDHLSWYQLTMEPNTPFGHSPPIVPDGNLIWELQQAGQSLLQQAGLEQYEISAYAKRGEECQHNLNYWRFGDYLGIGAGAHAKVTNVAEGRVTRTARLRSPRQYLKSAGSEAAINSRTTVAAEELPLEFMMNRLRLVEPFTARQFEERTGCSWERVEATVNEVVEQALLRQTGDQFSATERGRNFLNDLLGWFQ